MGKGIIWSTKGAKVSHAISWHDISIPKAGNIRLWLHSSGAESIGDFKDDSGQQMLSRMFFTLISVDIQVQGKTFSKISNEEKQARLEVAAHATFGGATGLKASFFRDLPFAKLEVEHLKALRACQEKALKDFKKPLKLANNEVIPTINFEDKKNNSTYENEVREALDITSTKSDSIVIAKVYSELSKLGTSKIVKQICLDLNIDSSTVYAALRVARYQGWLTANGKGKTGGSLTPEGEKEFSARNGVATLNRWSSAAKEGN